MYYNALPFDCCISLLVALIVFYRFTGLAYIDVAGLTQDNIRKSFDGNLWIMTKRQKTNTDVNVPLLDIPKMILKKYKGKLPNGKILPIISNQKLNAYLKEIADVCGIKKNLTFCNYYYFKSYLSVIQIITSRIFEKGNGLATCNLPLFT